MELFSLLLIIVIYTLLMCALGFYAGTYFAAKKGSKGQKVSVDKKAGSLCRHFNSKCSVFLKGDAICSVPIHECYEADTP